MSDARQIPAAFTRGYVLCTPAGRLVPSTWRSTEADAIAAKHRVKKTREAAWKKAQAKGWSVQFVYVRVFIPVFKTTYSTTEISEVHDVEDV